MLVVLLRFFVFLAVTGVYFSRTIDIISIVDDSSRFSALIKVHSIIKSAISRKQLFFHSLIFTSVNFTIDSWNTDFKGCFGDIQHEAVEWERPELLKVLKNTKFETDIIFARFYLPHIFPTVTKFIYLDNDIVVTCDLNELILNPLRIAEFQPPSSTPTLAVTSSTNTAITTTIPVSRYRTHMAGRYQTHPRKLATFDRPSTAIVGFVVEKHIQYKAYIEAHFNATHPLVQKAKHIMPDDLFLNAGVFVVDADRWRTENVTGQAQDLILRNQIEHMYSTSVGDQGLFYLLFLNQMAYLPAQYNMRRLPKKTVHMLEEGVEGIVHFAGLTHGDAFLLCLNPLHYPILLKAAVPLYLSVLQSFRLSYPTILPASHIQQCTEAIQLVIKHTQEEQIIVRYNAGRGQFRWPPSTAAKIRAIH